MINFAFGFLWGAIVVLLFARGYILYVTNELKRASAIYTRALKLNKETMEHLK